MVLRSGIPDPGVKKAPDPGSRIRIRNTGFDLLDPDPDSESGSGYGSTDLAESGTNPGPKHWLSATN